MANILFLSQVLPYPSDAGPKVRSYYTLRYLAQRHSVTLLAFTRPDDSPQAVEHLRQFCQAVHVVPISRSPFYDAANLAFSLLSGQSFLIRRDFVGGMAKKVDALLATGQYSAVHADQLWMAQYALRARKVTGIQCVLDAHNATFQVVQRLAQGEGNQVKRLILRREARVVRRFEAQAIAQFHNVVAVTQEDRSTLADLVDRFASTSQPKVIVIPICVDTVDILPVASAAGAVDVLHLGTMFWPPNVEGVLWFARQVWPRVRQQLPQATFTIVGKNPPSAVTALVNEPSAGIRVTGYVPDPQPYLEQAGAFIVPLFSGSGMRVKIVDGWRWGLPVVSTTVGAEGIACQPGENILIADTPQDFAQAVVDVLTQPELAQRLRQEGRRWVEERYDWRQVYPAWDVIYPVENK